MSFVFLALVGCGTAAPAPVGPPLTQSQLKFAAIDSAGKPAFCDPDYYPLARPGGELAGAVANYPTIKADSEAYAAIIAHEHLPSGDLTDDQKVVVYRAWKLIRVITLTQEGDRYRFVYRTNQTTGNGALYQQVTGTVRVDGVVAISSRDATTAPNCPICLAASTLISTPGGLVRITDLVAGTTVWTASAGGGRIAAQVVEVGSMKVPAGHLMVHLTLADGRELFVSPAHRTGDGRQAGTLKVGDGLDGSTVTGWELVPYHGDRTYDLLPAGPTGRYWANGILMSSTLEPA